MLAACECNIQLDGRSVQFTLYCGSSRHGSTMRAAFISNSDARATTSWPGAPGAG